MENPFTILYPVIFFNGEQEVDVGNIAVYPSLGFKRFQGLLAEKIGYPPQQISVVMVCQKSLISPVKQQKLPINENTNFALILSQRNPNIEDCFFHVILKKPRKERKERTRRDFQDYESRSSGGNFSPPTLQPESAKKLIPTEVLLEKTLLRRDPILTSFPPLKPTSNLSSPPLLQPQNIDSWYRLGRSDHISPVYGSTSMPERLIHMQENALSFRNDQNQIFSNFYGGAEERFVVSRGDRICKICSGSEVQPVPFHPCIYDRITAGFKGPSPFGPIERPAKGLMNSRRS